MADIKTPTYIVKVYSRIVTCFDLIGHIFVRKLRKGCQLPKENEYMAANPLSP